MRPHHAALGALAFRAVAAAATAMPPWLVSLATIAFANALVVLGLVILWRTGLVPFGQALFYAIGAYAVFLILEDAISLIWGQRSYPAYQPMAAAGDVELGDLILSNYDIGLVAIATLVAVGGYWALNYTRYGRLLTVVIFDRETAAAFGINVTVLYTATFVIGAMLGALGGAVMAPKISVTPGIGVEVIVLAFAVVATGGMGSIEGAMIGALIVGLCRAAAVHLFPQIELFVIYAVMALVLVFRPYGLISQARPRKI
jgi:branched-chain amino acid transport system permease protein